MKVVTSGSSYLDIDAYAGIIAAAELLNLQGDQAIAATSAPLNESITASLRGLGKQLAAYEPGENDEFVLVDISVEEFFDPIVTNGKVVEIIDHHPGYEDYWRDKIGNKAQIEVVGAACTQVFEHWQAANQARHMEAATAQLLAAGILDNTLNFKAKIAGQRDQAAYDSLKTIGRLPDDFAAQYFSECQAAIEADIVTAIQHDAKDVSYVPNLPAFLGQLVVWDAKQILRTDQARIEQTMTAMNPEWGFNLISIGEGKSYFLAGDAAAQDKLARVFDVAFVNNVSDPVAMLLRKEMVRAALDHTS